jgi:hypothetical protein
MYCIARKCIAVFCMAALFVSMNACTKSPSQNGQEDPDALYVAAVYPKGAVQGQQVQKTIDGAGGTIISADGKISLVIPAGALTSATHFSIQPITSTVPLGTAPAYRLLPADVTFAKPVTVMLQYDAAAIEDQNEEALDLVCQDNAGAWKVMNRTVQDKAARTLSVQTKRINDFSMTGYYYLVPQKKVLLAGELTTISIQKVTVASNDQGEEETPLGGPVPFTASSALENWEMTGPGNMDASSKITAVYTAPATVADNIFTEVQVNLTNARRPFRLAGKKINLRTKIHVTKGDFMAGFYDGQPFDCVGVSFLDAGGVMMIQGVTAQGKSVLLFVNGADVGNYPYGNPTHAGKSEIRCNITGDVYETVYTECGPPSQTKYASGQMSIKAFATGVVAGDFTATLYEDSNCTIKTKKITGSFRTRK